MTKRLPIWYSVGRNGGIRIHKPFFLRERGKPVPVTFPERETFISYKSYTDSDIINNAKTVYSMASLIRSLGLLPAGGNYIHLQKNLQRLKIDTSHWTGQGWNKNQQLKDLSSYTRTGHLKKHLIALKGYLCERCGVKDWLEQELPLELDHIDGDRNNNELSNLKLLCPNCHSQTPTWRRRKKL